METGEWKNLKSSMASGLPPVSGLRLPVSPPYSLLKGNK